MAEIEAAERMPLGHPLHAAVVRLRSRTNQVVGSGFLVTERHVLTCTHVVSDAVGVAEEVVEAPQDEVVLDFPLVAPSTTMTARVAVWCPVRSGSATEAELPEDIALLELKSAPPSGAKPVRCTEVGDPWGRSFRAFGFPAGHDDGVWAPGILRGPRADGLVQIEAQGALGYFVELGFSGAPIWSDEAQAVLGMVVLADRRREAVGFRQLVGHREGYSHAVRKLFQIHRVGLNGGHVRFQGITSFSV